MIPSGPVTIRCCPADLLKDLLELVFRWEAPQVEYPVGYGFPVVEPLSLMGCVAGSLRCVGGRVVRDVEAVSDLEVAVVADSFSPGIRVAGGVPVGDLPPVAWRPGGVLSGGQPFGNLYRVGVERDHVELFKHQIGSDLVQL